VTGRGPTLRRAIAVAVAALLAALVFVGLDAPIGQGDEVIYAENVREMQRTGDWGVLTYYGAPGLLRPAAPFVPIALVSEVIPGEVGLRLIPALCCLGILALVYLTCAHAWKRWDTALAGVLLCASAPTYFLFSRSLLSDPMLVLATTFALYATIRAQTDPRWLLGVAAGLGAGVAAKSLAAAVPGLALLPFLVVAVVRHRPWRLVALSCGLFFALAAPYFIYSYLRFGDQFIDEHVGLSLGKRAAGGTRVGMSGGITGYALHVVRNDGLPTALWMSAAVVGGGLLAWRKRDSALAICVIYAVVVFAVLSLLGTRLGHYLLPVYPALAIAMAGVVSRLVAPLTALRPVLIKATVLSLATTMLLLGLARPLDWVFLRSHASVVLGRAAKSAIPPGQPVYSLDWYAPALGYYADREWHLLGRSPELTNYLAGVYLFEKAGNIHQAPPWPKGEFVMGASRHALASADLRIERVLAESGDWVLVVARAGPTRASPQGH